MTRIPPVIKRCTSCLKLAEYRCNRLDCAITALAPQPKKRTRLRRNPTEEGIKQEVMEILEREGYELASASSIRRLLSCGQPRMDSFRTLLERMVKAGELGAIGDSDGNRRDRRYGLPVRLEKIMQR